MVRGSGPVLLRKTKLYGRDACIQTLEADSPLHHFSQSALAKLANENNVAPKHFPQMNLHASTFEADYSPIPATAAADQRTRN
ncbi:hypothetical protein M514_11013 [Trichuris suis]|uniref:Uncharacterized protein n=1 Tax=Trichuris suis TaxID=68888 RepID=A0A085LSX4_9BILA|nr:hypothetical protein M513_11013 [Trichuris suis]KFD59638.1 hypothetical protein M514_11013 [Trichuris suis]